MNKLPDILKHTWRTLREFKMGKRAELRAVDKALDDLMLGSAYLPREAYDLACNIRDKTRQLKDRLSTKEWGR